MEGSWCKWGSSTSDVLPAVASVVCVPLFREILKKPGADGMKICTFCHQNEVRENPNYKVYVCTFGRRNGGEVRFELFLI